MKAISKLIVLPFLMVTIISFAQSPKKRIVPQFDFTQIDSLVDSNILNLAYVDDSSNIIVSYTSWFIGSYTRPRKRLDSYRNYFEIFILYKKGVRFFIKKIDNISAYKPQRVKGAEIPNFIRAHFYEMEKENLGPKRDTSLNVDGSIKYISTTITDHHLDEVIKIDFGKKVLKYNYNTDYSNNKQNLLTSQYEFLRLMSELCKKFDKHKHKRKSVIWSIENPHYG